MEIEIIRFFQSLGSDFNDFFFKAVSHMASWIGFVCLFILMIVFYRKIFTIFFGLTYGLAVLINTGLKILIGRPRPYNASIDIINKLQASGLSMPSGHSLSAAIMVTFLVYVAFKHLKSGLVRNLIIISFVTFLFLVMISRMYLGQHYLSDTIAGATLGVIFGIIGIYAQNKIFKNEGV